MTEEIKHINKKNQEYIAEGNRMTKETKIGKKDVVACNYWEACDYYKQLKRLEQENNSLQAQLNNITVQSNNAITALEQENKELKETNKYQKKAIRMYDCIDKWGTKECHCACRCLGNEFCEDADKKINRYRSTLEEINRTLLGVRGLSINCDKQIIKVKAIINEVLNDK